MMRVRLLVCVVLGVCGCGPSSTAPTAGESMRRAPPAEAAAFDPPLPTLRLPRHFTPAHYTARLAIDPAKPTFDADIAIDGTLDRRSAVIWLNGEHLNVTSAIATNGATNVSIAVTPRGEFLELRPGHPLDAGHWRLQLAYTGAVDPTGAAGAYARKYGADTYVVSQFEAISARLVFPCFDEPDRKTPWQLTLDVPNGQVAVSNTPPTSTIALDAGHERVAFAETKPLPSYHVAFGIGPWEIVDAGKAASGLPLRVVTPRGTTDQVRFMASALPKIIDILEGWFAIPFPYPKLDVLVAPEMNAGAMENAGLITASARLVLHAKPTARDRLTTAFIIGHEAAHQWFGDLVTAAWWDDIWLNESFATWMEGKVLASFDPTWPSELALHRMVFDLDALGNARKIRQPIESEGDIGNSFDDITYPKGKLVLRMIEHQIGEPVFQRAIRSYVAAHANGNAKAADLFAALDAAAGASLAPITSSFFDQPGVPEVAIALTCNAGTAKLALAQRRFTATDDDALPAEHWAIPVCVAYDGVKHERVESCTLLDQPTSELALDHCPSWFAPAATYGYYRTRLDAKALETIRDKAWPALAPDERVAIFGDLWAQAKAARLPISLVMAFAAKLRTGTPQELEVALGDPTALGWFGHTTGLPVGLDVLVPSELRPRAEAQVRAIAEPIVRRLGLVPRADESIDAEVTRIDAVDAVVWSHSHAFDAEAKREAAHWRELATTARHGVLALAVAADPKLAERLRGEVLDERDQATRDMLFEILGGIGDPARHRAMLDSLVLDPRLSADDVSSVLHAGDQAAQLESEQYIRAHFDELMKRLPPGARDIFPVAASLASVIFSSCDATKRDERVAYAKAHFSPLPTAERPVNEMIDANDHCIAQKHVVEPSVRAWLGK
jgi:alanyl aminopeptidase